MENCPAPVVFVSPGRAPLDQQLHDLGVGAGGRQVKRGLVWGASSGPRVSNLLKLFSLETWSLGWPRPPAGPGPGQCGPETRPGVAGSGSARHARPGGSHPGGHDDMGPDLT